MLSSVVLPGSARAQRDAAQARIDTTIAFSATGRIDLSVPAGDISVDGWDRDEVRVRGTSERGDLELGITGTRLSVTASAVRRRLGATRLEVTVPRGASVSLRSHSGALSIRGIRGDVTASATSGSIETDDVRGGVSLTTVTGDIRGERLAGNTKAVAVNGNVALRNVEGEVYASTTNGRVLLSGIRSRSVRALSVNGIVEFEGTFDRAGTYEFQAHNGNITIYLPDGAQATLELGTYGGHVESDIPLTLGEGRLRGQQQFTFSLGGGGATISAQSHTGNIFIRRAPRTNR